MEVKALSVLEFVLPPNSDAHPLDFWAPLNSPSPLLTAIPGSPLLTAALGTARAAPGDWLQLHSANRQGAWGCWLELAELCR